MMVMMMMSEPEGGKKGRAREVGGGYMEEDAGR